MMSQTTATKSLIHERTFVKMRCNIPQKLKLRDYFPARLHQR